MHEAEEWRRKVPPLCAFLFSESGKGVNAVRQEMSRQQITGSVIKALKLIGLDTTHHSGQSMRMGGLTASFSAKIIKEVMLLLSGHGHLGAAEGYMRQHDPSVWYESFGAFKL